MRRLAANLAVVNFFALACLATPAAAQGWVGHEVIYSAPTRVNMGGRPVTADIALHADMNSPAKGVTRVALVTDVTKFIVDVEKDLEKWIAAHQAECGERWAAGKPAIDFPQGAIKFSVEVNVEIWTCGWNGKGAPTMLTREGGNVDVTLVPYVDGGKLQARLGAFKITERSGVSKYLPLEFVVRRVLEPEIQRLNENPKFFKAPKPFVTEGFVYESIKGDKKDGKQVVITARYRGAGGKDAYKKLADRVRAEGISAEGVRK